MTDLNRIFRFVAEAHANFAEKFQSQISNTQYSMQNEENEEVKDPVRFEDLPHLVGRLSENMESVLNFMNTLKDELSRIDGTKKEWLDIDAVSKYIPNHPAKPTIYEWARTNVIPHYETKKGIAFLKSDIDEWLSARHIVPDWWHDRKNFR